VTTYTAAIGTSPDVVAGELCQVSVIAGDAPGPARAGGGQPVLSGVPLPVGVDDPDRFRTVGKAAVDALATRGWTIRGSWWAAGSVLYAEAIPDSGNPLRHTWTGPDPDGWPGGAS
jgi:hypothetical protein